ncbi:MULTISPECIES: DUF7848 domain-containing protein [Streptomyces]|uniref:DUF7848 domain-containing protein n=1 Tax=Streptomyces TaxID=1883 RepID=UPI00224926AA|nr:hypothetical protein [Streptomyces sp. JHD 1]MCX2971620.1 hypothetical protein [Streptomyces sp. JHD 1]
MRKVYGVRRFAVEADVEPDAEPSTVALGRAVCEESSPAVELSRQHAPGTREVARRSAAGWVRQHQERNREHFAYRLVETHPYRLVTGGWL